MHLIFVCLAGFWLLADTEIPNFYTSFTSAREVAKQQQKETLVFFSRKSCENCFSAWQAFEMDKAATQKYISTRMDAQDFDGATLFDMHELKDVPSWIVLNPDGTLKEKWEGGWKDASGQPTIYTQRVYTKSEPKQTSNTINKSQVTKPETTASTATSLVSDPPSSPSPKSTPTEPPIKTSAVTSTTNGSVVSDHPVVYVLQAGYFGTEANAQKLVTELTGKGFNYFTIQPTQQNGSTFYRVISKSFTSESEANKENQVLAAKGIKTTVRN